MTRRTSQRLRLAALAFLAAVGAGTVAAPLCAQSGVPADELKRIWDDPVFQKQFLSAYGVNSNIEPRIPDIEVEILEKVRPFMADNLPKAEETLRAEIKPDCSATLDFTLGSICFQQDKLEPALECYKRAVEKFPNFRRAYRNIGLINVRLQKYDAAIAAFTRMVELGGADAYSYGLLGFCHASRQDFQPAEAAYRSALLLQPENTEWRLGLTRCVFKQGKFADAASLLDVLIAAYPEKTDFWMLQTQAFLGLKEPIKAAGNLEALHALGKSNFDTMQTLGDIYVGENLLDLATSAYLRAIQVDPKQPVSRSIRSAEVLASRSAIDSAQQIIAAAQKAAGDAITEDDRRKVLKMKARLAMTSGGGDAETALVLEEIVKLDPLDGEALMLLGQHYARNGEPDKGIFYYERAAGIESFEANAKVRHAQTLVTMGRYADALPLLRRAQEIRPCEDVARYIEQVDRIAKARR